MSDSPYRAAAQPAPDVSAAPAAPVSQGAPAAPVAPSRERLIEAAARVYAASGFRGATTRRIAEEAGVNEVTIFRLFGSKASLIEEALRHAEASPREDARLPAVPADPERELAAWCASQLEYVRERRALICQTMGEMESCPAMEPHGAQNAVLAGQELKRYMRALFEHGFIGDDLLGGRMAGRNEEAHAAGAMLMAALFGDAMGRDTMPDLYPQPAGRAAALYVRLFLRAIRCRTADQG